MKMVLLLLQRMKHPIKQDHTQCHLNSAPLLLRHAAETPPGKNDITCPCHSQLHHLSLNASNASDVTHRHGIVTASGSKELSQPALITRNSSHVPSLS